MAMDNGAFWTLIDKTREASDGDPESLTDIIEEGDVELESMLYAVPDAYQQKTGKDFPYDQLPDITYELKGEEWDEDTVDQKYPRLAEKFW